jgi:hypothetical protein
MSALGRKATFRHDQQFSVPDVRFRPEAASAALCYVAFLIHGMNKHLAGS